MINNKEIRQHIKIFSEKSKKKRYNILDKESLSCKCYYKKNPKLYLNHNSLKRNNYNNINKTNLTTMVKQLPNRILLNKNSNKIFKSKEIILCNFSKSFEDKKNYFYKTNNEKFRNTSKSTSNILNKKIFDGDSIFSKLNYFSSLDTNKNNNNINDEINYFHPGKFIISRLFERKLPSNNLYSILSLNKINYLYKENKDNIDDELKIKKKFFNSPSNSMTYILKKSKDNDLPIVYPSSISFSKNYKSQSEKERNDKNTNSLIKIHYFLENHWDKRYEIVNDFFNQNNIFDEKYYNKEFFDNFSNYIKYNFDNINCKKSIKEIIDEGIKYNNNDEKKKKTIENDSNFYLEKDKNEIEILKKKLNNQYRNNKNKNMFNYHHKYGKIDIFKEKNLANCLPKQQLLYLKNNQFTSSPFTKGSVKLFDENDMKELEKEINSLKDIKKNDNDRNSERNIRLYYKPNFKKLGIKPDELPRRKKKLLEYIILQNIKNKQSFLEDIKKEYEQ